MANKTKYKGVYYDEIHDTYYVNTTFKTAEGIPVKKCKRGFATAKKANDWKNAFSVEVQSSTFVNKKGKVESLINKYIDYKRSSLKPTTLQSSKSILYKHFLTNAPQNIERLKVIDIFNMYEHISNLNQKSKSKNVIISVVKNFVNWLDLTEQINPSLSKKFKVVFLPLKSTEETKNSYILLEDYVKFINTFNKDSDFDKLYMLLYNVLFFTGARISEALALKFEDVNFDESSILFNKQVLERAYLENKPKGSIQIGTRVILPFTKTNSIKNVSVPEWLIEDIKELRSIQDKSDFVFYNSKTGVLLEKTSIRLRLKRHLELANLPLITLHDLRHSHTTMLYDSGCDGKYVAERLGHSSEKISKDIYNHLTKTRKQANDNIVKNFKI